MCMFGNRSQKASRCGEKKQEAQEVPACNKFLSKLILIIFNKLNFFSCSYNHQRLEQIMESLAVTSTLESGHFPNPKHTT